MNRRRKPPPRVLRHLMPCPDCAATARGGELQHEASCPISSGIDAACDDDRRWFIEHPAEWTRTRAISHAELLALDHLGTLTPADRPDHVHVMNAPWGRVRTFCDGDDFAGLAIDPDDQAAS